LVITFLKRALNSNELATMREDLGFYKPDIIVFQFGIVDCVRRALPRRLLKIVQPVRPLATILHGLARRYHRPLTRLWEIHDVSPARFQRNVTKLIQQVESIGAKACFIPIAAAGRDLATKVFSAQVDIDRYNAILARACRKSSRISLVDPYKDLDPADYILPVDGHHLNEAGNDLVCNSVLLELEKLGVH
jgi:lysophospholipase L1-like esterase